VALPVATPRMLPADKGAMATGLCQQSLGPAPQASLEKASTASSNRGEFEGADPIGLRVIQRKDAITDNPHLRERRHNYRVHTAGVFPVRSRIAIFEGNSSGRSDFVRRFCGIA